MFEDAKYNTFKIGRHTYGDPKVLRFERGKGDLEIGAFTSIAPEVVILLGGEHKPEFVTTFLLDKNLHLAGQDSHRAGDVHIGNDVWLGYGSLILSGVVVGDGAVVGARTVVASNVEPYAVVVGNPARVVRKRFGDDAIAKLLAIKWWCWSDEKIRENSRLLLSDDVDGFVDRRWKPK